MTLENKLGITDSQELRVQKNASASRKRWRFLKAVRWIKWRQERSLRWRRSIVRCLWIFTISRGICAQ